MEIGALNLSPLQRINSRLRPDTRHPLRQVAMTQAYRSCFLDHVRDGLLELGHVGVELLDGDREVFDINDNRADERRHSCEGCETRLDFVEWIRNIHG